MRTPPLLVWFVVDPLRRLWRSCKGQGMANILLLLNLLAIAAIWDQGQRVADQTKRLGDAVDRHEKSAKRLTEAANILAYAEYVRMREKGVVPGSDQSMTAHAPSVQPGENQGAP